MSLRGLSFEEIAFEVCSAFDRVGIVAVLSGGGAASIHAPKAYQTRDLDFVLNLDINEMPSAATLTGLGFVASRTRGTYEHPEIPYTLEILTGPLGVGDELLNSWETRQNGDRILRLIKPIDSVKDRLAAAIHYKDLSSAKQAAEIAKLNNIDLGIIESWCLTEGGANTFAIFKSFLAQ